MEIRGLIKIPQPYPDPDLSTLTSMFSYANLITDQWLMTGFFIVMPIALVILFKKTSQLRTSDSLTLAFFLSLMLASLAWAIDLVEGKVLGLLLAALAFSILYMSVDSS